MVTLAARREAASHLCQVHGVSQWRACQTLEVDRSSIRCRSRRPDDGPIRLRLRAITAGRRRFGYRRLHILLRREGLAPNHKKLRRFMPRNGAGSPSWRPQASARHKGTAGVTAGSQPALVDGLAARSAERRPALSGSHASLARGRALRRWREWKIPFEIFRRPFPSNISRYYL